MRKITIAIDGFSSTGKSTLAKQLAEAVGYIYVDTGAMYRAVTLFAMRSGFLTTTTFNKEALLKRLETIELSFRFNPEAGYAEMHLNGENVESAIRSMAVSQQVSKVAKIPEVRRFLVKQQQAFGEEKGIVMDGRDIGTVVFPDAELKIFMTASAQTRAERRYKELKEKGEEVSFDEVLQNIQERDRLDSSRKDSPLRKAEDAVEVDNSKLSKEAQFAKVLELVKNRISS